MNSFMSSLESETRTHSTCVSLEVMPSLTEWRARVRIRGVQGIWYLEAAYHGQRPTSEALYFDTYTRGVFSSRPFRPGSPCDVSTDCCVLALVRDLCRERRVDAAELIRRGDPARPRYSRSDFVAAKTQADWEGTVFPVIWNPEFITALCLTLEDRRWGDLSRLVCELRA